MYTVNQMVSNVCTDVSVLQICLKYPYSVFLIIYVVGYPSIIFPYEVYTGLSRTYGDSFF